MIIETQGTSFDTQQVSDVKHESGGQEEIYAGAWLGGPPVIVPSEVFPERLVITFRPLEVEGSEEIARVKKLLSEAGL